MSKAKSANATKIDAKTVQKVAISVNQMVYMGLVAEGVIDPSGKSDVELHKEFEPYIKKLLLEKFKGFHVAIDYTGDLLEKARGFAKQRQYQFACLFYATWLEHWVNYLIRVKSKANALAEEEIKVLIRDTGLKAKYQCLPSLLGVPRLSDIHINTALHIAELRNGFVHYKSIPTDVDDWGSEAEHWILNFRKAEKAIRYFQSYERKHVYRGQKKRTRQLVKIGREDAERILRELQHRSGLKLD